MRLEEQSRGRRAKGDTVFGKQKATIAAEKIINKKSLSFFLSCKNGLGPIDL